MFTTRTIFSSIAISIAMIHCANETKEKTVVPAKDTIAISIAEPVNTIKKINPDSLLAFARTLVGIPYLYGSTDPKKGFDCSGFITYVFNHFHVTVPRSSVQFTNYGKDVALKKAKPGDLLLFTGTDKTIRVVGHMGIVESTRNDTLHFIHSSSGKANGVTITPLNKHYQGRFVKVIRVLED